MRDQFPLILSYAMTIHKSQGLSLSEVMVDAGNSIFGGEVGGGMIYVALSRVRTQAGLHLMNFDPSKANANKSCMDEINRLRSIYKPSIEPLVMPKQKLAWVGDRVWCSTVHMPIVEETDKEAKNQKRKAPAALEKEPAAKRSKTCTEVTVQWPKFDNARAKVACYSNSAFQALFALKKFQEACEAFSASSNKIKKEVSNLLEQYQIGKAQGGKRIFTASVRNALGQPFRNQDGQQCAHAFTLKLISALSLKNTFDIESQIMYRCKKCKETKNGAKDTLDSIKIRLNQSNDFEDMLFQWEPIEGYACTECGENNTTESVHAIQGVKDQMILYIHRYFVGDEFNNTPITNFDPDQIYIGQNRMKAVAAILYYGNIDFGHYVAIVRSSQHGWLHCDDHTITKLQAFPNDLKNVVLVFMEKA